ncbi:MAG: aldo/keto reductase [Chloroflexi bacterium]|nr:aldo/keto reductase [Chloroflexota bacterium]MDA1226592.1 aldo/keto reductase [Chloroflexota bacterium]
MEYRKIGHIDVSAIGMGTYRSFDVRSERDIEVRRDIIANCLETGLSLIDSSPMYGNAERVIGLTTQGEGTRGKLRFATKVWTRGRAEGQRQIRESFELMGTDHIDLFQVHNLLDWRTHLDTLEDLKEQDAIGAIGITHYTASAYPEMLQVMKTGRIDAIQVPYNVLERACDAEVLPLAEELGIAVLVMEPLEKGRYVTGLRRPPNMTPLADFGVETWAQALLAWVISDHRVTSAIPATSRPERILENAKAGDMGNLPEELRDYVRRETERCL